MKNMGSARESNVDRGMILIAALLLLSLGAKSLIDVDGNWDTWAYHLPFAARLWGIAGPGDFILDDYFQPRFDGFGLLAEFLQGFFWTVFQRPQAANLVGWLSLSAYIYFLRAFFSVPWHLTTIALLAVPAIQAHVATAYIDLPGGIATAATIMVVYTLYAKNEQVTNRQLLALFVAAFCAANIRLNHAPIIAIALLVAAPKILPALVLRGDGRVTLRRSFSVIAILAVALAVIFATPLKNTLLHGNPVYPVAVRIAGYELNHAEDAPPEPAIAGHDVSRPVRWVLSTLELVHTPLFHGHWSIDQASTGDLGGFMGVYVLFNVALLGYLALRHASRETRLALAAIIIMSVVTAAMPNSARLRYYMYWMIVLVSLNLFLTSRLAAVHGRARWINPRSVGIIAGAALVAVIGQTRGTYVRPVFRSLDGFIAQKVDKQVIGKIEEGEVICTGLDRWQFQFAYADVFHPPKNYTIKQASSRAQCGSARILP